MPKIGCSLGALLIVVLINTGCAKLQYVKVPTATQYSNWDDAKQAKADAMEGVRYYLPRPFLNLKKSTPIAQRVAFVTFRLNTATDEYEVQFPEDSPTWLRRSVPKKLSAIQALALAGAKPSPDSSDRTGIQSGADGAKDSGKKRLRLRKINVHQASLSAGQVISMQWTL